MKFDNKNTYGWLKIQIKFKNISKNDLNSIYFGENREKKEIYQFDLFNMNKTICMWPKIQLNLNKIKQM